MSVPVLVELVNEVLVSLCLSCCIVPQAEEPFGILIYRNPGKGPFVNLYNSVLISAGHRIWSWGPKLNLPGRHEPPDAWQIPKVLKLYYTTRQHGTAAILDKSYTYQGLGFIHSFIQFSRAGFPPRRRREVDSELARVLLPHLFRCRFLRASSFQLFPVYIHSIFHFSSLENRYCSFAPRQVKEILWYQSNVTCAENVYVLPCKLAAVFQSTRRQIWWNSTYAGFAA